MRRLLAPDGCPWDREQTPESLKRFVLEEAAEVMDAIDDGQPSAVCEELGDLALQVVFLAQLYQDAGEFGPDDVIRGICEKLVHRHPHVFGDGVAETAADVAVTWEAAKRREKGERPLLASIPRNLPALLRAEKLSSAVARVGFDWPDAASARLKVEEERGELERELAAAPVATTPSPASVEEFGDLLFALTSWGRHLGIDPEAALSVACDKFQRRFAVVERCVKENHGDWPRDERMKPTSGLSLDELDGYWEQAKAAEKHPPSVASPTDPSQSGQ